ncbi:MAG: trypsin-like peptidase domain-containing protein [Fibrobacteria bacterium]|nr:trypsin-like peptidase domain-containing protein [Fibrobacteria bacterium]
MKPRTTCLVSILVAFAAGLGTGSALDSPATPPISESAVATGPRAAGEPSPNALAQERVARERSSALVEATRAASPSVVSIVVTSRQLVRSAYRDPFYELFYGPPDPQVRQSRSMGSGVVVDARGYVLTNHHVVESAAGKGAVAEIVVTLPDGRSFPAKVVGSDKDNDLAVLRVEAKDLPVATLARDVPEIGSWVLAIGNPFGYLIDDPRPTVTAGVVSALDRTFTPSSGVTLRHVIQTDAAINPGNSGGALVNAAGELVGINTFIFTGGGQGSIGLGFAIPVARAMRIVDEIVRYGRVRDFTTGLVTDPMAARAMGLRRGDGVLVTEVQKNSPGARAGVAPGDIIIGIDGRKVSDLEELRGILRLFRVGDRVPLKIRRDTEERDVSLELAEAP